MNWINRVLTDVFTITALFSVAVGTFLGYINRRGEERSLSWLYFSVLFLFLGLFVFFDNTLAGYFEQIPTAFLRRIPVMMFCQYGLFVFSVLILAEELSLSKTQCLPLLVVTLLLVSAPLASLLILRNGIFWYNQNLSKPVLMVFGLGILFTLLYTCILFFKKKKYRDFQSLVMILGIFGTGLFLYITKISQYRNPELYQTQTYLLLVLFLLVFLFLLSRQSHLEYRELKELRRAGKLLSDRTSGKKDIFNTLLGNVKPDKLPFPTTERECRIIRALCSGMLYKEIALEMEISISSVKKGVHCVYKKAGVQNRVELIRFLTSFSTSSLQ